MRSLARPLLVLGSGLSGSLLLDALHRHRVPGPVLVVDACGRPTAGRRWAGFAAVHDPLPGRALHRVRVVGSRGEQVMDLRDHRYVVHDGDRLARSSDDALCHLQGHRVVGEVIGVDSRRDVVRVRTSTGDVHAAWVFDSTRQPSRERARPSTVWMHFRGMQVRARPGTFDPDTVTLMDFTVPARGQVRFGYVLPGSDSDALIELTALTGCPEPVDLDADLHAYADRVCSGGWTPCSHESGTSPLQAGRTARRHGRVLDIGARAGLVRASTGYGMPLVARDADVIASRMARGRSPRGVRRPWRYAAMDAVMLRLILTDPATATASFQDLFVGNPIDRVARFMIEDSDPIDDLRMSLALPVRPLLRAAVDVVAGRLRQAAGAASGS